MRTFNYARLCSLARRESRDASGVEDLVQEALLAAVMAGRTDLDLPENFGWLMGAVRNRARMAARSGARRRRRESRWLAGAPLTAEADETAGIAPFLATLPPALRVLAALALSGHTRREIAYLLALSDTALRQRISALKRQIIKAGLAAPTDLPGLSLDLAYGRIRDALLPQLLRDGGAFASHDPDGHLFVIRRSQKPDRRQLTMQPQMEGSS